MRVKIVPSVASGTVCAPPSKSVAHRALICGALSEGSTIHNIAFSQDVEATLRCLTAMGALVIRNGDTVTVGGLNPFVIPPHTELDCGESGSTLRFLLPLCLLAGCPITLRGSQRLMERPLDIYQEMCREQGFSYIRDADSVTVCGRLQSGVYRVPGDVSSQFITGLLLALPLLEGESRIEVTGAFESASYVGLTLAVQKAFNVCAWQDEATFAVRGGQRYFSKGYTVEGDCSNAAFLDAFNLISGDVKVFGLTDDTAQGDWIYRNYYTQLRSGEKNFDLADCPDLGPVMFALAAAFGGASFAGTARLRIKESDRAAAMAQELAKFGVPVIIEENTVTVCNASLQKPSEVLCGHNDHRIVMALSLLCSKVGGIIDGSEAVAKSFPNYFDTICSLGIEVIRDDI